MSKPPQFLCAHISNIPVTIFLCSCKYHETLHFCTSVPGLLVDLVKLYWDMNTFLTEFTNGSNFTGAFINVAARTIYLGRYPISLYLWPQSLHFWVAGMVDFWVQRVSPTPKIYIKRHVYSQSITVIVDRLRHTMLYKCYAPIFLF